MGCSCRLSSSRKDKKISGVARPVRFSVCIIRDVGSLSRIAFVL